MSSNIRIERICKYCGKEFTAKTTKTLVCSSHCSKMAYKARKKQEKIKLAIETKYEPSPEIQEKIQAREFLSVAQTCILIGISKATFYRLVKDKRLMPIKLGKRTIIKRIDIDNLLKN